MLPQYYFVLQSTTPYYKVLLQYYFVLQSTSPVLQSTTPVLVQYYSIHTTKYYSSTASYYKVLLQYYFVLQSTTPVLLRTTKYYSMQYYSYYKVLSPVLLCTTKYYPSTTKYYSSTTKYYSSTTSYYNTHMLNLHHIWNLMYSARSNSCHDPTSPNSAPVTRKDSHTSSSSHMKPHLQCAEQQVSRSNFTKYCTCHAERLACLILITYETSLTVHGATGVTIQLHQIQHLSRGKTRMLHPHHIWNVIYSARSNRCHDPTSPNTAPVTRKDSHASSSSHMKRHLQCAEQQVSPSNITRYCACHTKFHSQISQKILKTVETSFPMRGRSENVRAQSEHNPSIKPSVRNPPRKWGYFRADHEHFLL